MRPAQRRLILAIVATDATFVRADVRGETIWVGKCLHCGARLAVSSDGAPLGTTTVEHIVPRSQGGTDDVANVALACARCNHEKGVRHDARKKPTARAQEVIAKLQERRRARWRTPG